MLYDICMIATIIPKTGIGLYRIEQSRNNTRDCRISSYYSIKFVTSEKLNMRLELLRFTENLI